MFKKIERRRVIFYVWVTVIATALYLYFFRNDFIRSLVIRIQDLPLSWRYTTFLIMGCLRGFTFIPVTYLIFLSLVFLPVMPAYILTMVGVMVSSATIYYFSEFLGLAGLFERSQPSHLAKLRAVLQRNELPIVIAWSFLPFMPTDLMCYVCGSLKIDVRKFLLGVFIGESIMCAIYIFAGREALLFLAHKLLGV